MSPTGPAPPIVARWPKFSATLDADGTGVLTIDGRDHALDAPDLDAARAAVLKRVTKTAAELARPVRLTTKDPDGEWELAVKPDGSVDELAAHPSPEPDATAQAPSTPPPAIASQPQARVEPTTPAPLSPRTPPQLSRSQRRWTQPRAQRTPAPGRRQRRARIGVALVLLLTLGAAGAVVATNGPDTLVKAPGPAAPAISQRHSATVDEAILAARRRSAAQRAVTVRRAAAARERRADAARRRRLAARQARERRALANRRIAARQARQRAATARRRAASSPPPTLRPAAPSPPRPSPVTPAPPPPPPPAQPTCGEFDLC